MNRYLFLIGMVLVAVVLRLLPHPVNFAPIGAIALFAGARFENRGAAFLVPMLALFVSDVFIGLHSLMPFVYGCFALNVLLGIWVRRQQSIRRTLGATLLGSTIFFLVTNFGVWAMLGSYPLNSAGLLSCYVAGLPFFVNTVLGDIFYVAVLFGGLALAEWRFPAIREIQARVA